MADSPIASEPPNPAAAPAPARKPAKIARSLGLMDIFAISAGAMISSGLFVLPGIAFALAGPAVIVSYALASVLVIPVMLAKAELATAMPKAGGSYFYVDRSLGPLAGTIAGFANWLSISLKTAFALVGIGAIVSAVAPSLGDLGITLGALLALLLFGAINLFSTGKTGRLQVALVAVLLAILLAFCFLGFGEVDATRYMGFASKGWGAIIAVAGMVFVSYGGLTKVASVAGEVRNPSRSLPMGMFLASVLVSLLYVGAVFVTVGLVEAPTLSGSLLPLYEAAHAKLGPVMAVLIEVAAFLAFATTANAGILSASRSPMAMGVDGLVPLVLSKTNRRFGTPHVSVLVTMAFVALVVSLLSVEDLVKTASTMILAMFVMVNISILIMRASGLRNYRPTFRMPLVPWLPIFAIASYGFLIFEMGTTPLLLTGGFVLLATLWYLLYVYRRIDRESAFVYMVKGVVSKDLGRAGLESELKQITLERDSITRDRFDELVDRAAILELEGTPSAQEFFRTVSAALAPLTSIEEDRLYELFLAREAESSTEVQPGLAIPHAVVEGEGIFAMAVVRAPEGIRFDELHPPIRKAFALVGSRDERNFHLRALMHIAHIVQEDDFERQWKRARTPEELRDALHLSARKRF